jgi:hypothetical protein
MAIAVVEKSWDKLKRRTWHGYEKRRDGDILMQGTLGLLLNRNLMEIFSGPKNDPLVVKSRVKGQYDQK